MALFEKSLSSYFIIVLYSLMKRSVRCIYKRGQRRGTRKQSLIYSQVLERQSHEGPHGRECKGSRLKQARGEQMESTRTHGQVGVSVEYPSKRHDGISLEDTKSQKGECKKENLWQGLPHHMGTPGRLDEASIVCFGRC